MAIKLHTNFGVITLELDHEKAPVTAANFEQYVKDGFYNGVIFHRVIPGFMIQGGGMTEDMHEKDTRDGFDVVDAIEKVATKSHGYHDDVPVEPVVIEQAEIV